MAIYLTVVKIDTSEVEQLTERHCQTSCNSVMDDHGHTEDFSGRELSSGGIIRTSYRPVPIKNQNVMCSIYEEYFIFPRGLIFYLSAFLRIITNENCEFQFASVGIISSKGAVCCPRYKDP